MKYILGQRVGAWVGKREVAIRNRTFLIEYRTA